MAITKVSRNLLSTGVSDSSDATAITITSGENIGIGTDTPSQKLHVYNSTLQVGSKTGDTSIQQNTNAIRISAVPNSSTEWGGLQWYREFSDYIGAEIIASRAGTAESDTDLILKTSTSSANATERMRITHGGLVGIGATSPAVMLDVRGEVAVDYNASYGLRFYNQSRNNWASIGNQATDSTAYLVFKSGGGETLRLTHAKEAMIGKTTTNFATAGIRFQSNGNADFTRDDGNVINVNRTTSNGTVLEFYKDGSSVGSISTNSNSLPSDLNFKKDITDLDLGLNLINKLKPSQYNYKIDDKDCPKMYGLIAQDLEQALQEVGVEKNSIWLLQHEPNDDENQSDYSLDYTKLIPILINSIQEQQVIIEDLQTQINEVKNGN